MQLTPQQQQYLLDVARSAIRAALRGPLPPIAASPDPVMNANAGCFVSLHDRFSHRLRGCVGRLQSPDPLLKNVYESAGSALTDPRFRNTPITVDELPRLQIELSILSTMVPAVDPMDFDLLNEGIYLQCCGRSGTFLPQVARQTGWTKDQLLARLCAEKLGLLPTSWQDPSTKLFKYTAAIIGPVPFFDQNSAPALGIGAGNLFKI